MKKLHVLFILLGFGAYLHANPVNSLVAKTVAINFYTQNLLTPANNATLVYTEKNSDGIAVYYVFDMNDNDGFVIVSADDALKPIIGYNNKGHYTRPSANTNMGYWMNKRKTEIITNVKNNAKATPEIADYWNSYVNNTVPKSIRKTHHRSRIGSPFPSNTFYLVQSTWDQYSDPYPSPYWTFCPDSCGSTDTCVTGCVATTMSQIMRYWQYPPYGTLGTAGMGYYYGLYCIGNLSAAYDHPYNWANMTLTSPPAGDLDIARLMSDAGVSVAMEYGTVAVGGSGAQVLGFYPSAQYSYPNFFGYSTNILDGIYEANFSDTIAWQDTLEHELDCSRPIQYAGYGNQGGHTWVCDGYDANNFFHMNWGWSGYDNGWYSVNNLSPYPDTFNVSDEALIGIMPPVIPLSNGCDTITNMPDSVPSIAYTLPNGFVTGCYGDTIQQIADYFASPPISGYSIVSVSINFAKASSQTVGRTVNVNIWDNTGTGGAPGNILASKAVTVSSITTNAATLVTFSSPVNVATPYYVGVDFTNVAAAYTTDTIVVATDATRQNPGTAWQYDVAANYSLNGWYTVSSVWNDVISHAIWVDLCQVATQSITYNNLSDGVILYPNPTNGKINAQVSLGNATDITVEIYNLLGERVQQQYWGSASNATYTIDLSGQPSGMYFIKMSSDKMNITKKIMVSK